MPIRTHRGRAAVYRRLWGWPLRSPKHLVGALIVLAALATTIGVLLPEPPPRHRYPAEEPTYQQRPAPPAPETANAAPPTFSVPNTPAPPAPPSPQGLAAAEAWGKQWVNHPPGTAAPQWVQRLAPYTTDEFITEMATVDPANVPATAVTGPPAPLRSTANTMDVRLPTDGGDIEVEVVKTPQGWRVSGYDKVS